jgi:hypothetical protein
LIIIDYQFDCDSLQDNQDKKASGSARLAMPVAALPCLAAAASAAAAGSSWQQRGGKAIHLKTPRRSAEGASVVHQNRVRIFD